MPAAGETVLTGLGGSPGSYTGRSRIITGLDQAGQSSPVTSWSPRSPTPRGRRCSSWPERSWSTSARSTATPWWWPANWVSPAWCRYRTPPPASGRSPGHRGRNRGNHHRHDAECGRQGERRDHCPGRPATVRCRGTRHRRGGTGGGLGRRRGGGASVGLFEKSDRVGGTTAISGGGCWVPCSAQMAASGIADSRDDALRYLRRITRSKCAAGPSAPAAARALTCAAGARHPGQGHSRAVRRRERRGRSYRHGVRRCRRHPRSNHHLRVSRRDGGEPARTTSAESAGSARTSRHVPGSRATTGANASMERCAMLM